MTASIEFVRPTPSEDAVLDLLEEHVAGLETLGVDPMQIGRALIKGGLAQVQIAAHCEVCEVEELEALTAYLEAKVVDLKRRTWT